MLHFAYNFYVLQGIEHQNSQSLDLESLNAPARKRSKKWRHGISKEAKKKVALAKDLNAVLISETCVTPNYHVSFCLLIEAYYEVHMKKEPYCTCFNFQKRGEAKKLFLASKHM